MSNDNSSDLGTNAITDLARILAAIAHVSDRWKDRFAEWVIRTEPAFERLHHRLVAAMTHLEQSLAPAARLVEAAKNNPDALDRLVERVRALHPIPIRSESKNDDEAA